MIVVLIEMGGLINISAFKVALLLSSGIEKLSSNLLWQNSRIWDYDNVEAHFRPSRKLTHKLG